MRVSVLALMLLAFLWQCKLHRVGDVASVRAADDALKVAVNYIGDRACMDYWKAKELPEDADPNTNTNKAFAVISNNKHKARQIVTHMINGPNGELISEEYRASAPHRKHLLLSGDSFFDKHRRPNSPLDMQMIADNCRRLVLSVDSDVPPTIIFEKGFALRDQKQELQKIAQGTFGELECLDDQPFCSFKCGISTNAVCPTNKRYFSLVWPDNKANQVKALVHWEDLRKRDNSTITIPYLTYQGDAPAMWQRPSGRLPLPEMEDPSVPGQGQPPTTITQPTTTTQPPTTTTQPPTTTTEPPTTTTQPPTTTTQPPTTTTQPPTTTQPFASSDVYTADKLAIISLFYAMRIAGTDRASITLAFTALQNIRKKWDGRGKIKIFSTNSYKLASFPRDNAFSIPQAIHPNRSNLYSGNKLQELVVTDTNWQKGERHLIEFVVQLDAQGSATFKAQMSRPAIIRSWKKFKGDAGSDSITITVP